ncbi:MAG: hydantoinase/oxoprolinase family protein [Chloroflexi bacterium]|nr:hydantoinase/oxoprolinase family protein [Chloroflexota bacterium]
MSYTIAIDVGGTCTDCVVVDEAGVMTVAKAFSTPPDFSAGMLNALRVATHELGMSLDELLRSTPLFLHSTTVAENAIVDGTLCKGGLLVTRGFEDTLYMTRGGYGRWSGLTEEDKKNVIDTDKPPPVIPFAMIKGIKERTDYRGRVLASPSEPEVEEAIRSLMENGAEAIGVCFLWSFRNPENEQLAEDTAKKIHPDLFVTRSSVLAPINGEYERTSAVALNVCLGPIISRYLANLRQRLQEHGFQGAMLVMQAHGGLLTVDDAPARSLGMVESGPVGGLVGSKALGASLGFDNILATDMGGTTFKSGVIRGGSIEYQREPMVARYHYALHKMDVVSIGLAGGSIISLDPRTGMPKVGPRSAGAFPGPVCYGFAGQEPTITDVDLILGYLTPRFFLGGRAGLDRERAWHAFESTIAEPLDMETVEAAGAVYRLANSLIYDLLHRETVEKGLDPREYALFAYGGTAGMHMAAIAPDLGVKAIVIPHSASVHGAFGLVSADVVYEDIATLTLKLPVDPDEVNAVFAQLTERVVERLSLAGFERERVVFQRSVDMRYSRQVHVINTSIEGQEPMAEGNLERLGARFEAIYAERYGKESGYREAGIEMVSFVLRGIARLRKPELTRMEPAGHDPAAAYVESREVYVPKLRRLVEVACYDFVELVPGNQIEGPSVIWTPVTTVVVDAGQRALCDRYKNIVITW